MKATSSRGLRLHLLGDVDHRPADAALAELGRREQQHHGLLAEHVGEVVVVHRRRREPGVDRGDVAAHARLGRRVDARRRVPTAGIGISSSSVLHHDPGIGAVAATSFPPWRGDAEHLVAAGLVERDLGRVDRLGRVRVRTRSAGSGTAASRRATRSAPGTGPWPARRPPAPRTGDARVGDLRAVLLKSAKPKRCLPVRNSAPDGASTGPARRPRPAARAATCRSASGSPARGGRRRLVAGAESSPPQPAISARARAAASRPIGSSPAGS